MSKKFKTQDYFRFKRLGKRWRRPVGTQSKLRLKKGGSGMKVAVGYGKHKEKQPVLVTNIKDFEKDCTAGVIFASGLGSRKTIMLSAKAKELGLTVINKKKVKRASRLIAALANKKTKEKKKSEKKAAEKAAAEKETEKKNERVKKMGFHESMVPQVMEGKTKTYRLRDHKLTAGDTVDFENSQTAEVFGKGTITSVERKKVREIDIKDPDHGATYDKVDELIAAFKRHYPDREVTPETEVHVYSYKFDSKKK